MVQEPSLARARAWAPLGLLFVLACGAWFFGGTAWQGAPGGPGSPTVGAPSIGRIQPSPEGLDGAGAVSTPGDKGAAPAGPSALQVLEEVAQRGRQAAQVAPSTSTSASASATLSADALQARVRQDPAVVHRQTAGQRLRLQGALASVEAGEPGVVVLHLALAGEPGTVRVVASPALAATAAAWAPPKALSLDCLSQGVMMGEWLLVDCRE